MMDEHVADMRKGWQIVLVFHNMPMAVDAFKTAANYAPIEVEVISRQWRCPISGGRIWFWPASAEWFMLQGMAADVRYVDDAVLEVSEKFYQVGLERSSKYRLQKGKRSSV